MGSKIQLLTGVLLVPLLLSGCSNSNDGSVTSNGFLESVSKDARDKVVEEQKKYINGEAKNFSFKQPIKQELTPADIENGLKEKWCVSLTWIEKRAGADSWMDQKQGWQFDIKNDSWQAYRWGYCIDLIDKLKK